MSAAMEKGDWWNQGLLAALGFKGADPGMAWDEPELGKPGNMSVGAGSVLLLQLFSRNLSNCPKPPVHAFMMSKRGSGSTRSLMSITSQRHRRGVLAHGPGILRLAGVVRLAKRRQKRSGFRHC